jgi:hypothetical protein
VTIGAHGRLPVGLGDGLSVNALLELFGYLLVALAASRGHVEFEDGGFRIFGVEYFVSAVTVGADSRLLGTVGDGMSVHALFIRGHGLHTQAAFLHDELLAVTCPASCRNVAVMDARLGVAGRQQLMWTSVAVDASGGVVIPTFDRLGVKTALVGSLLIGVAGGTGDSLRRSFMRGILYVRVAIHAREHAAMNGVFECLRINVQANGLAIDFVRQRSVAVAGQAFVGCGLGRVFLGRGVKRARR